MLLSTVAFALLCVASMDSAASLVPQDRGLKMGKRGKSSSGKMGQGKSSMMSKSSSQMGKSWSTISVETMMPTSLPTKQPTLFPRMPPTCKPTAEPVKPTSPPTMQPTIFRRIVPTAKPTAAPSTRPTPKPTSHPTMLPTKMPTNAPTALPTTASPTTSPTASPTLGHTKVPSHSPTGKPTTAVQTFSPTRTVQTFRPTQAPWMGMMNLAPTVQPTLQTMSPSSDPKMAPSLAPHMGDDDENNEDDYYDDNWRADDYYDDYYDDNWRRTTVRPTRSGRACRCADLSNCTSSPLPHGESLALCIFAPRSFSMAGLTRLLVVQGDQEWNALDETPDLSCQDNVCMVQVTLDDTLYGPEERIATIMGIADLDHVEHSRRLAVNYFMEFGVEITLGTANTTDGFGVIIEYTDNNGVGIRSGSSGSRVLRWLFPVLSVAIVAVLCIASIVRKRKERRRIAHM